MKNISIQITEISSVSASIEELDRKIPDSKKQLPEFDLFHRKVTTCIEGFITEAKKYSKGGTSLQFENEIIFSDLRILIILKYPHKANLFDWVKRIFGR